MDASHLSKAHDHARAAAVATRQSSSDPSSAITEHTHAAGEFANAARTTSSVEALRTLRLLEQHHKRLAEILQLPAETSANSSQDGENEKSAGEKDGDESSSLKREGSGDVNASAAENARSKPMLSQKRREMSSSIASNLASARGIRSKYRSQPLVPSISNDPALGNVDAQSRRNGSKTKMQDIIEHQTGKPSWVPPPAAATKPASPVRTQPSPRAEASTAINDDAGYGRFYNTFGSIINKISAPLAFAGLPLIQEESTVSEQQQQQQQDTRAPTSPKHAQRPRSSHGSSISADANLSKIYSRATMRALAHDGHAPAPSDSFYVVPTSGHTISYANILTYAEKERRRLGDSAHSGITDGTAGDDGDDDFVDARESMMVPPAPLSPGVSKRRTTGRAKSDRELNNTIEELQMENKSLKDVLDKLSKRLQTFEASAQNSALAMAESYRVMRPSSPLASGKQPLLSVGGKSDQNGGGGGRDSSEEKLVEALRQMERLEKDNKKLQGTLERYRDKWAELKKNARARRAPQGVGESVDDPSAVE